MAEIDLKQASIFIRDGFALTGAVNHAAGYIIGDTTMLIDLVTTTLLSGGIFTLAGDTTKYTITAHSETSSATTSITFTPGLVVAPADDTVITFGPHEIEIVVGEGNLTYSEHAPRIYKRNKERLHHVKNGPEEPVDVNFDLVWEYLKSDSGFPITPREALTQSGAAAGWVTSSSDPCEPYAVDILVVYEPLCTSQKKEYIYFEDFRHETIDGNVKDGTLGVKGKSNRTVPTLQRVA